jgi:hypothetical protein
MDPHPPKITMPAMSSQAASVTPVFLVCPARAARVVEFLKNVM